MGKGDGRSSGTSEAQRGDKEIREWRLEEGREVCTYNFRGGEKSIYDERRGENSLDIRKDEVETGQDLTTLEKERD